MDGFDKTATILKAMSHPARLQIMEVLRREEACVCHLENALDVRQAYISQQLARLRRAGLVTDRREGMNVFYALADPGIERLLDVAHETARAMAARDGQALSTTPLVPGQRPPCPCPKCAVANKRLIAEVRNHADN